MSRLIVNLPDGLAPQTADLYARHIEVELADRYDVPVTAMREVAMATIDTLVALDVLLATARLYAQPGFEGDVAGSIRQVEMLRAEIRKAIR